MKRVLQDDYYNLYISDECLYMNWAGFQLESSVKRGCDLMFEAMIRYGLFEIINDNTLVKGLWDHNWVARDWFPRMVEGGLRRFAWIKSPERLSCENAELTVNSTPYSSIVQLFDTRKEAQAWIGNCSIPYAVI